MVGASEGVVRQMGIQDMSHSLTDCNSCDSDPLLHDLLPNDQLHPPTRVKLASPDPSEH